MAKANFTNVSLADAKNNLYQILKANQKFKPATTVNF